MFSPADIFDGVREEAENLVLLGIDFLALSVHPSPTRRTLHHAGLVVVVIISTLSKSKLWSLMHTMFYFFTIIDSVLREEKLEYPNQSHLSSSLS